MLVVDQAVHGLPVRALAVVAAQGRQALRSTQPQVVRGVMVFHPISPAPQSHTLAVAAAVAAARGLQLVVVAPAAAVMAFMKTTVT